MKKALFLVAGLLFCLSLAAQGTPQEDPDLQYATEMLKPGTQAPDFLLKDIDGKPVRLSDFRGKTVVLVFWASWCPDCRAEVPLIKQMHAAANPEKVAFVSVSFDRREEAFRSYVQENQLPGIQLFDAAGKKDSKVGDSFRVRWIPALYLIGPDGKIQLGTVVAEKVADELKTLHLNR